MAAKQKIEVVSDIIKIFVTNGNVNAVQTKSVLLDILDCAELNAQPDLTQINAKITSIETVNTAQNVRLTDIENKALTGFSIKNSVILKDTVNGAELKFSIRGIKKLFANINLSIKITKPLPVGTIGSYKFVHNDTALTDILKEIFNVTGGLDSLIKVKSSQAATDSRKFKIANLNFNVDLINNSFLINIECYEKNETLLKDDAILTSLAL